jgi:signal transduction histidine kinase
MSQRPTTAMIAARVIEYAGLAGLVGGSFLVVVLGGGAVWRLDPPHPGLTLAAAALLGASFEPARRRLRRLANRLVYGHRSSPWEAVRRLSVQMGSELDPAELLRELSEVVRSGTGAAAVVVWLRIGGSWLPVAASPDRPESLSPAGAGSGGDELPRPAGTGLAVPIRHGGELLGAITVGKPGGGPLLPLERRLVTDLAAHAGIVTRTLHLRESRQRRLAQSRQQQRELVAARARLVAAHDAERRRLERDIHDSCQQPAVVLAGRLGLAGALAGRDPDGARAALAAAAAAADRLATALDRLTRGTPVPELAAGGIAAGLRAQTGHLPGIEIDDRTRRRHPAGLEAAVYFCCLEAIQNATKHAAGAPIRVQLSESDGYLGFRVRDGGPGFDPDPDPDPDQPGGDQPGTGLRNLRERLRPWHGRLTVRSSPTGTEVRAEIPVPSEAAAPAGEAVA